MAQLLLVVTHTWRDDHMWSVYALRHELIHVPPIGILYTAATRFAECKACVECTVSQRSSSQYYAWTVQLSCKGAAVVNQPSRGGCA